MNTKEKIAEIAFQLFTQNGYKATSIAQLVTNSGLSKGAFYHHFKSKQAVYEYVIDCYFLSYYRDFDWVLFEKLTLDEFKDEITNMYIEFISQIKILTQNNPSKYFILFFEAYNNMTDFKNVVQTFYKTFKEVLSKKHRAGKKTTVEVGEKEAMNMITKFEGLFFWFALFPEEDIHQYLNN